MNIYLNVDRAFRHQFEVNLDYTGERKYRDTESLKILNYKLRETA